MRLTSVQLTSAREIAATAGFGIESRRGPTSHTALKAVATAAGALFALAIVAMTVGTIRSEAAAELRTLTATGAGGTIRRALTAATAATLAAAGVIVGTVVAYLGLVGAYAHHLSRLSDVPVSNLLAASSAYRYSAARSAGASAGASRRHSPDNPSSSFQEDTAKGTRWRLIRGRRLKDLGSTGFESRHFDVNGVSIFARFGGNADAPTLVLLHGYPQTHVMWHRVAQALRERYFIVLPDLRGYGDSSKPAGLPDHSNYSKRTMAQDVIDVMDALDRDTFFLCGHDRGGRVGHRLALDHPAARGQAVRGRHRSRRWTCTAAPTRALRRPTTTGSSSSSGARCPSC